MTRSRSQYNKSINPDKKQVKPVQKEITFWPMLKHLFSVIWWRVAGERYIGKKCLYKGLYRKITAEDYNYFFLSEFPKFAFPKKGNKLKIKA